MRSLHRRGDALIAGGLRPLKLELARRDRIEIRVFDRLRSTFDTPEPKTEFTSALAKERLKLEGQNGTADIDRLRREVTTGEKARDTVISAIAARAARASPPGQKGAKTPSQRPPRGSVNWRLCSATRR